MGTRFYAVTRRLHDANMLLPNLGDHKLICSKHDNDDEVMPIIVHQCERTNDSAYDTIRCHLRKIPCEKADEVVPYRPVNTNFSNHRSTVASHIGVPHGRKTAMLVKKK